MRLENEHCKIIAAHADISHDDWLAMRKLGIGGSDAAAICGMNPWRSSMAVYADKKGLVEDQEETEDMIFGKRMEPHIRDWFAEDFQKAEGSSIYVFDCPWMMMSKKVDWMIANIDGLVQEGAEGELGGVELKARDRSMAKYYADDSVMDTDYCQVQHYMHVTGLPYFYVVALLGKRLIWRRVPRNEEFIAWLFEQERDFHDNYLVPGRMPAPSGLDSDDDILKALYGIADGEREVILEEFVGKLDEYVQIAEEGKRYAKGGDSYKRKKEIQQLVELEMGTAKYATAGDHRVTWSRFPLKRFDLDSFRKGYPQLYEGFAKESLGTKFTVKTKGEKDE